MDAAIDAVGHADALELAVRLTRKGGTVAAIGVYAERIDVHMGIIWIKAPDPEDRTSERDRPRRPGAGDDEAGLLDPSPLVTHHMSLEPTLKEAYAVYDRREALKIVMTPMNDRARRRQGRCSPAGGEILAQGAEPVGWKIGFNVPALQEKLGIDAPLAGFLDRRRPDRGRRDVVAGQRRRGGRGIRGRRSSWATTLARSSP